MGRPYSDNPARNRVTLYLTDDQFAELVKEAHDEGFESPGRATKYVVLRWVRQQQKQRNKENTS